MKAETGSSDKLNSFFNLGVRWGCLVSATPRSLYPGKTWYPLHRRLGGPQGRSERVLITSSPPGFEPRTSQPVASHYTDLAIPIHGTTEISKRIHWTWNGMRIGDTTVTVVTRIVECHGEEKEWANNSKITKWRTSRVSAELRHLQEFYTTIC